MLLCCAARDCGPKSGKSGVRYSICTLPKRLLPPLLFLGAPPNLHRHRLCRRPPASIFSICRAPSHKSDGATDDVSAHLLPPSPTPATRTIVEIHEGAEKPPAGGAVWSARIRENQQRRARASSGGCCCCCRGIPIKIETCTPPRAGSRESGGLSSRADLATWDRVSFLRGAHDAAAAVFNVASGGGRDGRRAIVDGTLGVRFVTQAKKESKETGRRIGTEWALTEWADKFERGIKKAK